jgi:dihydropteroate synthase
MGILNVTPDSFFDGGRWAARDAALARAWEMVREGADLLDVGGESSRPGAEPVGEDEELRRVIPLLEALLHGSATPYPLPVSVDTVRSRVAREALAAGARIVNDISAGLADPAILELVGEQGAAVVLMHMRGTPRTMQQDLHYADLPSEVATWLTARCEAASAAGIPKEHQAVDPGIGFGKSAAGCVELLGSLAELETLGRPVLVGASRKSFLSRQFGQEGDERLPGSLAAAALAVAQGASIVRVHDIAATRGAVDVAAAVRDSARARGSADGP